MIFGYDSLTMKRLSVLMLVLIISSCELLEVEEFTGTCTIILADGTSITTDGIEVLESTETITYRDEDGKLWSLFKEDYESYDCN